MTPAMRARLQAAFDHALARTKEGATPAAIIQDLVKNHGGSYKCSPSENRMRVAGVAATCTWSKDDGLLTAWKRLAIVKLMEPAGGYGSE